MPISEKEKKALNHDLLNMISYAEPLKTHLSEIHKKDMPLVTRRLTGT